MYPWSVSARGAGPRLVLVHGSVGNGSSWGAQAPLAERFELVVPDRGGYWPNPPLERIDFEEQGAEIAELLEPGTHLVGHSYGGVVSLVAAGLRPERIASLTLLEPAAFGLVRGIPSVERMRDEILPLLTDGPDDPRALFLRFLAVVGSDYVPPDPLPRPMAQGVRALRTERPAWDLEELPAALDPPPFPCLVVSGGHMEAHERLCDFLAERLRAVRATLPGARHHIPRVGAPLNELLTRFVTES
jgi:pimeloyl-ACP methyl ester carboxylesterase